MYCEYISNIFISVKSSLNESLVLMFAIILIIFLLKYKYFITVGGMSVPFKGGIVDMLL